MPLVDLPDPPEPKIRSRAYGRRTAVAVSIGLFIGVCAFAFWKTRSRQDPAPSEAQATVSTPAETPRASRLPFHLWAPTDPADFERLLGSARTWLGMVPEASDGDLMRAVWAFNWRGIPFPSRTDLAERPAAAELVGMLRSIVAAARAEPREPRQAPPPSAPPPDEPPDADPAPVRETPTPGCFYLVRTDDALLGDDGITARALHGATARTAQAKGWPRDKAERRAAKLASESKAQADYAELILRSSFNGAHADTLAEGELLWLPPLLCSRLLDRTRRRQVVLDPRPWRDGSSKLDPAPHLWHAVVSAFGSVASRPSFRGGATRLSESAITTERASLHHL